MADTIEIEFHGAKEALEIVNTGGDLVKYLTSQREKCPLIGSKIKLVRELGKGEYGAVYLIDFPGMGKKKYVVKVQYATLKTERITVNVPGEMTLQRAAKQFQKQGMASADVIIALNGDPKSIIDKETILIAPMFAMPCKTDMIMRRPRFDGRGSVMISKGSYLCRDNTYSEYILGVLCGKLYRDGVSANFIDTFGFAMCPKLSDIEMDSRKVNYRQYVFMEKINYSLAQAAKTLKLMPPKDINSLFIQTLHAIATYQTVYQLQHNDLHFGNIFVENVTSKTKFNGQRLHNADYYHYRIGKVDLYIPATRYIIKIGDFGLSVKYSKPLVGDRLAVITGYNQRDENGPWVPNWYCESSDSIFATLRFYDRVATPLIMETLARMIGVGRNIKGRNLSSAVNIIKEELKHPNVNKINQRPSVYKLGGDWKRGTARTALTNKFLMKDFLKKPEKGKIVTLGVIE